MTSTREVVAVTDQVLAFDELALKQLAVLFSRIGFPGLTAFRSVQPQLNIAGHLLRLADIGILFEPKIAKSDDHGFMNRTIEDMDKLLKPSGVSAEEVLAARTDEKKALELREKRRPVTPESLLENDPIAVIGAMLRMATNMTRMAAVQLRNLNNLDAHAVVSNEFTSLEQDDEDPNRRDVLQILIDGLPLPDKEVSWEQIIDYRSDPNSLNRFLDLRNWISDIAGGKFTSLEAEQRLEPVLKRFRKQMEIHQMKTVSTTLAAFVTTSPHVIRNLLSYPGGTKVCFFAHRKLVLLEGEALSDISEVAFVLGTTFLSDQLGCNLSEVIVSLASKDL